MEHEFEQIEPETFHPEFSPKRASRYEMVEKIGGGAFGQVFEVRDILAGKRLAAKTVRVVTHSSYGSQTTTKPDLPKPIFRELHTLRLLAGHENIVLLVDAFPQDSELVFVFEFCPSDLELVIAQAKTPIPERFVKCFIRMLLAGISYIHSNSLLHRDIKPANCLIAANGQLKICDFGLARPRARFQPKAQATAATSTPESLDQPETAGNLSHQVATRW
jgi:serine/threonine protein kinase